MDSNSRVEIARRRIRTLVVGLGLVFALALGITGGVSLAAAPPAIPSKDAPSNSSLVNSQAGVPRSGAASSDRPLDTDTPTDTPTPSPVCTPGGPYLYSTSTGAAIDPGTTDTGNHGDDVM